MKKLLYLFLLMTNVHSVMALDNDYMDFLSEELGNGQILEVYQKLEKLDPNNKNVDVFLSKLNLALNLYVVQVQFEKFGFVNLLPNQNIEDIRGKSGKYELFSLNAHHILDSLVKEAPEDARLYKAQVDYFYECYLNYSKDMSFSQEELLEHLEQASRKSIELKSADYETYFILGYVLLGKGKFEESQRLLKHALSLNENYGPVYYNLAYAEFALKNFDAATKYAKTAWDVYTDTLQKTDAARMLSYCFDNQNQIDSAVYYLEAGRKLQPKNSELLRDYLHLAVRENLPIAEKLILEIILLSPESPEVYNAVINAYYQEGDNYLPVLKILNDLEKIYASNNKVMANLCFYQGQILFESSVESAKAKFRKSEAYFLKFYPPTHEVFGVIKQYLDAPIIVNED